MMLNKREPRSRSYYGVWFTFKTQFIAIPNIRTARDMYIAKLMYGRAVMFLHKTVNCTVNKMYILSYYDGYNDILYVAAEGMACSNSVINLINQPDSLIPIHPNGKFNKPSLLRSLYNRISVDNESYSVGYKEVVI